MKPTTYTTLLLFILLLIGTPLTSHSQTPSVNATHAIRLKDGSVLEGRITHQSEDPVVFIDSGGKTLFINQKDIDKTATIQKNGSYRFPVPKEPFYIYSESEILMQYGQKIGQKGSSFSGVHATYGMYLTESFFLGVGAGMDYNFKNKTLYMPLFLRFKAYLSKSRTRPFLALTLGYTFDLDNYEEYWYERDETQDGTLLIPSVGVSIRASRTVNLDISAGYRMQWIPAYAVDWRNDGKRVLSGAVTLGVGVNLRF